MTRANSELGWEPKHWFKRGVAETIDWYVDHQGWVQRVLGGSYHLERIGAEA